MANLTTQSITRTGVTPTYAAASAGGDTFTPDENTVIHCKNGSGGSITLSILTPGHYHLGLSLAWAQVSIPAGQERMIGPFNPQFFADPSDGLGDIAYSAATSVTIGVFYLTQP
jgi:hypothetical protein